jgi:hypothetical protein
MIRHNKSGNEQLISRPDVLNGLLRLFTHATYLEVGVNRGETFLQVKANRKVAVDPKFLFSLDDARTAHSGSEFHEVTSDIYFSDIISPSDKFQLIYLDGLHTFEQTLRDFVNATQFLAQDGIIVIDDVIPSSYQAALPDQLDAFKVKEFTGDPDNSWMGDTYKLVFFINSFFPGYNLRTISNNHGQAVVWRRPRAMDVFRSYTMAEIVSLEFLDVIKQEDVFHKKDFDTIFDEIRCERKTAESSSAVSEFSIGGTSSSTPILNRQSLETLAAKRIRLAKPVSFSLPNSVVYNNISEFDAAFGLHYDRDIYAGRSIDIKAIDLVQLEDATLYPEADYIVTASGGVAVEEQMPPWMPAGTSTPAPVLSSAQVESVTKETVIIARFGAGTWGHWLGELLPKLVSVEVAFPGRFQYAVPADYFSHSPDGDPWKTFRQSLQAYGIPDDRLLWLRPDRSYKLETAWAVTPVWSDHQLHPHAAEVMRCAIRTRSEIGLGKQKVAVLRQKSAARTLVNWTEIDPILQKSDFTPVDVAALDFLEQVAVFRSTDILFSVLGSGLTGLIYSPAGVRVVSAAPSLFGDRFFYALVQDRRGRYADVRGPIVELNEAIPHRSSFTIDPERVLLGLKSLSS